MQGKRGRMKIKAPSAEPEEALDPAEVERRRLERLERVRKRREEVGGGAAVGRGRETCGRGQAAADGCVHLLTAVCAAPPCPLCLPCRSKARRKSLSHGSALCASTLTGGAPCSSVRAARTRSTLSAPACTLR